MLTRCHAACCYALLRKCYSNRYLLNCFIVVYCAFPLDKATRLHYIFACISMGHALFQPPLGDRLFLVVYEACTIVLQLLNTCKTQREDSSQSLRRVTISIFQTTKMKPPQSKVYLCRSFMQTLFSIYFICIGCFYLLMVLLTWKHMDKLI